MSVTTRSLLREPKTFEASWPTGLALLALLLFVTGHAGSDSYGVWAQILALGIPVAGAAWLSFVAFRSSAESRPGFELERSLLYVVSAMIAVRILGGYGIDAYALVYLMLALVVSLQARRIGLITATATLVMEWGAQWMGTAVTLPFLEASIAASTETLDWTTLVTRSSFIAAFGVFAFVVHSRELLERRKVYRREVEQEREKLQRDAHQFRLLHSGRSDGALISREETEEVIVRDAVDAVYHTIYVSLSLLKTALGCHTCVLLWLDVRNEQLHIKELVSESDAVIEGTIDPARGVLGGIARQREPVNLQSIRSGFRGLSYYRSPQPVTSFLGVPVIECGHLRGILCIDRIDGRPFEDSDVQVVQEAATYIMRSVENERMFTSIEKTRYELGRFYEASRKLNDVLTPEQVYEVALQSVAQIVPYDFAAMTLYCEEKNTHTIVVTDSSQRHALGSADWQGRSFPENRGLVSMVIKNRHYLPFGGQLRDGAGVVFTEKERIEDLKSMLVLPLIVQDRPIGTLVIAHREAQRFSTERREMLEVVGNQVAITLQNARLYAKMEEMASFDALTRLPNRRMFQEKIVDSMARHKRTGRTFGLILMDIDHFKPVNDTYGHPAGDEVLRQVSACIASCLREVDLPARYGGEEFVIVLEDTDLEGGKLVANRVREEISKLVFSSEKGPFSCTISMGYALGPLDSEHPQELIELADQALYYSKENGRNRVTAYREMKSLS